MVSSLIESIERLDVYNSKFSNKIEIPSGHYNPAFWIHLLCLKESTNKEIVLCSDALKSFANTIGFTQIANPEKSYPINRSNRDRTYTLIQRIDKDVDNVDKANSGIMSCLRESASSRNLFNSRIETFNIAKTIGELHDNVKSHSLSTGFSMAQYVKNNFEFSISDTGIGFLNELKSKRINVSNDKEAIEWCLQKGNSTKKIDEEFSQSLPGDIIFNPMPGVKSHIRNDGNYHQGLGLYILKEFAKLNSGTLEIVSGDSCYLMDSNGIEKFNTLNRKINGVSITIRLNLSKVDGNIQKVSSPVTVLPSIKWEISEDERKNYPF